VYQLKITPRDILPPIWQRIQVPAAMRLVIFMTWCKWPWDGLTASPVREGRCPLSIPDDEFDDRDVFDDTRVDLASC
jgi:hypothetical protein